MRQIQKMCSMSKGREKLWRVKYMEGYKIYTGLEINGVKECLNEKIKNLTLLFLLNTI